LIDLSTDNTEDAKVELQATPQLVQLKQQAALQQQVALQEKVALQQQVIQLQQQLLESQHARFSQGRANAAMGSGLDMLAAAAMGSKP
jgi:hypothetical protein